MLRWEGVPAPWRRCPPPPHLFLNTHPRELADPRLLASLQRLRENWPEPAVDAGDSRIGGHQGDRAGAAAHRSEAACRSSWPTTISASASRG